MRKEVKEKRTLYIKLIALILQNIKDLNGIKRVYNYAQSVWYDENVQDPGG